MFFTELDERQYAVKPMNCPTHCLIYKVGKHSYRDLPIRYADFGRLHRYERSGVTSGLTRVRSFAQDDAHVFCTDEQVEAEVLRAVGIILDIYRTFEFTDVQIGIGTRPEKRVGTDEQWEVAEAGLRRALDHRGLAYTINEGDGAFYGPEDRLPGRATRIGRQWQLGTVQLDYQLPQRFDLEYVGRRRRRAAAGDDPPRHAGLGRALPRHPDRAHRRAPSRSGWRRSRRGCCRSPSASSTTAAACASALAGAGLRAELDESNEKLGYKIRQAQLQKMPYMLVVGEKEQAAGAVAVRLRTGEDLGPVGVEELVGRLVAQAARRSPVLPPVARIG